MNIQKIIEDSLGNATTAAEKAVLKVILEDGPVTQQQIALSEPWLGSHPEHEDIQGSESTLRQIRQIVRTLRVDRAVPILADRTGYWFPTTQQQVTDILTRMEREAKARAKASMETHKKLSDIFRMEAQGEFFQGLESPVELTPKNGAMFLFVYGTLRSGWNNNYLLRQSGASLVGLCKTANNLTLTASGIPYLGHEPRTKVVGEVWEIQWDRVGRIDQLEGHPTFYEREEIKVKMDSGETVTAWAYFCDVGATTAELVESGDFAVYANR
jgi:gamma-glutamylcyclotransferase (GGCT)/AIG2-like uncharacterized protein YtfP